MTKNLNSFQLKMWQESFVVVVTFIHLLSKEWLNYWDNIQSSVTQNYPLTEVSINEGHNEEFPLQWRNIHTLPITSSVLAK